MKQRGFTLIELMIVIVMLIIIGSIVLGAIGAASGNSHLSIGYNGVIESRCIEGYKFVSGEGGAPRQILDEFGKGVRCDAMVK